MTEPDRFTEHARAVTSPSPNRDHVETHMPTGLRELRSEFVTDNHGSDVLVALHKPQLRDRHAPELSNCTPPTNEGIEVSLGLVEIGIGCPLLTAYLPFTAQVRVLDR